MKLLRKMFLVYSAFIVILFTNIVRVNACDKMFKQNFINLQSQSKIGINAFTLSIDATGYTVEADIQSDAGIRKVQLPTWTSKNGQDDIQWYTVQVDANNHIKYHVDIRNHNYEDGEYITHLYVTDQTGRRIGKAYPPVQMKKTPMTIKNAQITSIDATGYTIEADIQSDYGVNKVQLPTWTSRNGQDDIRWYTVQADANNHIKYHIDIKNHNYEDGEYITHLYVTDQAGRKVGKVFAPTQIKRTPLTIKNVQITSIDATGYTIEADIQSDYGITKVQLPTWTSKSGQDDIQWYTVNADTNNHINYYVDIKNHNYEDGEYITHIYVTDQAGRKIGKALKSTTIKKAPLMIKNAQITSIDATGYTIEADIQSDYGITKVQLPTWTSKNGQDDIQWYTVPVDASNHIRYHVDIKNHNYEDGEYITHIYVTDQAGRKIGKALKSTTIKKTPLMIKNAQITLIDAKGYTIEADFQTDYGISKVQLPTWTSKNGQDDIQWYTVPVDANNHIRYHVDIKNHNYEDGEYITHLYVTDQAGRKIGKALASTQIKKTPLMIKNAQITSIDATGYTIEADFQTDYGISKVQLPTWTSKNGKDDIIWYTVNMNNNHLKYRVSIKNHKFETGEYNTHLYVYDVTGRSKGTILSNVNIQKLSSGFHTIDDATIYVNKNGSLAKGFLELNNDVYYFHPNTLMMAKGKQKINGRNFVFHNTNGKVLSMTAPIPYFNQADGRWGYKYYGSWPLANTGCVPTAAAMVFSFLSGYTTPDVVANWAYHNDLMNGLYTFGSVATFWPRYSTARGAKAIGSVSMNQAISALKRGNIVVAAMNPGIFTSQGTHEIVLYGIDSNNMVQVYDPLFKNHNGKYPISVIFAQKSTHRDDTMSGGPIFIIEK